MNKEKITLYGGGGFVGSEFRRQFPDRTIKNARDDLIPHSSIVVNFISTVHNYHVYSNPHLDIDTNLSLLIDILEKCKQRGVKKFVFISSWFVYGSQASLPVKEDAPCYPRGFYSSTKYCAENLVRSYCETFGMEWQILRLANVIGIGDKKASKQKNALQWLIQQMVAGEKIELYEAGDFYRDYVDVRDCARAIMTIVDKGNPNEIYNIGNKFQSDISLYPRFGDLIGYIHMKTDEKSELVDIESKKFHQTVQAKSMILDASKLHSLGYTPQYSIYETLSQLIDYEYEQAGNP